VTVKKGLFLALIPRNGMNRHQEPTVSLKLGENPSFLKKLRRNLIVYRTADGAGCGIRIREFMKGGPTSPFMLALILTAIF